MVKSFLSEINFITDVLGKFPFNEAKSLAMSAREKYFEETLMSSEIFQKVRFETETSETKKQVLQAKV